MTLRLQMLNQIRDGHPADSCQLEKKKKRTRSTSISTPRSLQEVSNGEEVVEDTPNSLALQDTPLVDTFHGVLGFPPSTGPKSKHETPLGFDDDTPDITARAAADAILGSDPPVGPVLARGDT